MPGTAVQSTPPNDTVVGPDHCQSTFNGSDIEGSALAQPMVQRALKLQTCHTSSQQGGTCREGDGRMIQLTGIWHSASAVPTITPPVFECAKY